MGTRKQLEEALVNIALLEKKLSESQKKEGDLLKMENENRKNTDVLNRIIEYNPYSIQILNPDGYHIRENKAFRKLFKVVPGEKWSILKDPQMIESGLGKLLRRVTDGYLVQLPPVWYNVHLVDPKYPDNLICIGSVIFPVFLLDGKLEFIVLMHEDITNRMEAKEALKNSVKPMNHLLSSNPAVIYSSKVVPPYNWTFISDNVSNLTGFDSVDFLNNQNFWSDHVHPDDRQKVNDELALVLEKGSHILEYRFHNIDGSYIWVQGETKLICDSEGNPLEMIGYWIDINKRKQAEEKFIIANKELVFQNEEKEKRAAELIIAKEKAEESDSLKSAFLSNMSHEVRTPLNSIIGFSELLADPDFKDDQKDEFIKHIITNGNNLLNLISNIMDISKLDSGELKIHKKKIIVHNYILNVEDQYAHLTKEKNLELTYTYPLNREEIAIFADPDRLMQLFNNLMSNAIKFTANGKIEIGYQPIGNMVEFCIKDTGIGIPEEFQKIIFERFRQVNDQANRKYGGNGLGLSISKNLVELMGGEIRLESEPGKGSVFYFTLPIHKSHGHP
ncbi:MAG: PAS domain-containing sensor histidine kinase [Prolixibacteraceae bacterium]|jgi:PAS domain S-box-containing protein|nr:PAS domain-containing sensor histidine kinase [Prolixibacteraceae bacterium]